MLLAGVGLLRVQADRATCKKFCLLGVVFVPQWVQNGYMERTRQPKEGAHTMSVHSSTQLANGHTLTLVEGDTYRVEERNELGTYLYVAFTAYKFGDCEAWIARAVERGYGFRPTTGQHATMIAWYDSNDPTDRRRVLTLSLSSPEGKRGTLYECEREHPGDIWPASVRIGSGHSVASAEKMARQRGLVARVES